MTTRERDIIRACQRQKRDVFGTAVDRTVRLIGHHLSEIAQWNVMLEIVRKLTARRPKKSARGKNKLKPT